MNNQKGGIAYFDEDVIGVAGFTWNPVTGCTFGCPECWARVMATRLSKMPYSFKRTGNCYLDVEKKRACDKVAAAYRTFKPTLHPERLTEPLKRKKPAVIGVCFMGDLFDPDAERFEAFRAISSAPQHTYIFLTKRPDEMAAYVLNMQGCSGAVALPNWFLGFSARNQAEFDAGWPHMARLAAAGWRVWVSLEPMQEAIDLSGSLHHKNANYYPVECRHGYDCCPVCDANPAKGLSGVILGAQSGKNAVILSKEWVENVRDQCAAAGVPFMFKQGRHDNNVKMVSLPELDGKQHKETPWSLTK